MALLGAHHAELGPFMCRGLVYIPASVTDYLNVTDNHRTTMTLAD